MEEIKITFNQLAVNYKTFGHGKPVLVLHGWGGKSNSWVDVGELMEQSRYQVIIPDLPGFGKSQEPETSWTVDDYLKFVEDFVAEMKLEKFSLIGHSFGGGLAAMYVAKYPQKMEGLVLCDSAIIRKERLGWRQSCAKGMAKAKKFMIKLPFSGGILPLAQKAIYKLAGVQDYHAASPVMKETFKNITAIDLSDYARQIKIPALIIWGSGDKSTPVEDAFELNKIIAGSKLEIINNCGHNPHRTHTSELAGILISFLNLKS